MKKNSILSQSIIDPNTFFYYTYVDNLSIGIYNAKILSREVTNSVNTDFIFNFVPCKEIENSILLDGFEHSPFFQFTPTFSWSNTVKIGAFTTGCSKYISILETNKEVINIEKIGIGDTLYLDLDWNFAENNSNLLLSCELYSASNPSSANDGVISVFDLHAEKKIELGGIKVNRNNRLGYPNCGRWVDPNCIISSWNNCNNTFFICLNDIRMKRSAIEIKRRKCTNYLSINRVENSYLLSSNMNDTIEIIDMRSLSKNNSNDDVKPVYGVEFEYDCMRFLSWFPFEKNHISISTNEGVFIVSMNNVLDFQENFDSNSYRTKTSLLKWNKNLLTYFEPIKVENNIMDGFCWCNKLLGDGNGKYSLAYVFENSLNYISNFDFTVNSFRPRNNPPFFSFFAPNSEIKNKFSNQLYRVPQILGYSWIPYRLIKHFGDVSSKIENPSCLSLLSRWQKINCEEAQMIVREYQKDQSILKRMGIYVDSVSDIFDIIRLMKSVSYTFNLLCILPSRLFDWKEIVTKINSNKSGKTDNINPFNIKCDNLFFPGYRDIINAIKYKGDNYETIYKLEFIKITNSSGNFDSKNGTIYDKSKNIEVFSSEIREKLVSSLGVSLNVSKKYEHKSIEDTSTIENNLLTFLWNCVTLKYPVFLSQCNYISELLNVCLESEFKPLKLSFMNNLVLFLNSVGIMITNLYKNNQLSNLDKKDISFYHSSVISTSEQLLDDEYYLPIWNCNIFLESTLQISIRFLVVVINYLYLESEEFIFSYYLIEHLLVPCLSLNSYIYIPSHLLMIVSLYYLPMNSISNLIEVIISKMSHDGLLDCIYIIGLQPIQITGSLEELDEKSRINKEILVLRDDYSKIETDVLKHGFINAFNPPLALPKYDGTKSEDNAGSHVVKNLLQRFLSISFGDIQTIALFGSCFFHYYNSDFSCKEYVGILNKCIDEYRKLLKSNSTIIHSINRCEPTEKLTSGYRTTKLKLNGNFRALYELNILSSNYLLAFGEKGLEIPFFSIPSGNAIYCYYCEQPLTQKCYEPNNIVSGISNLKINSFNSHNLKKESEMTDNNDFQKHFQLCEQEKTCVNIGPNKSLSNTSPVYQHDTSMNFETPSIILNCPNKFCNKPLTRCVICLSEMSLNLVSKSKHNLREVDYCEGINQIESWYSWCLYCHHGGCFKHINEWFECFDECPVPECNCWCNVADPWFNL
ncbi:conserved COOH terminal-specific cysteine rich domain [Cryptosporidium bovis]|uniref:conserved COOH terminal-specific cysteine rich domain n=1 Tax=Cryptosporidium bovis TaxID=310047 RepID=UPI003519E9B7|nr:conserved COOH terminal-specific cysteine rich domain [Cryptosporidium bovis]